MSAVANSMSERVRVWQVVPTVVHPEAVVDMSAIEPTTGLTQRAARELANERNHATDPSPQVQWKVEQTRRVVKRGALSER